MEAHDNGDSMIKRDMTSHIKGKRTKRRRPSPVLALTLASTTSSTTTTTSETSALADHGGSLFQLPATTSIEFTNILQNNHVVNNNKNDQDIADCLMLLAHGHQEVQPRSYVYECKTCDRGFTSFQALGGHRASHNKPQKELAKNRLTSILVGRNTPLLSSCNPRGFGSGSGSTKVHECSICGSEFTSGQALGGHMRRHRPMTMTTTTTTTTTPTGSNIGHHEIKKHKTGLRLDLNLPAPDEDDYGETNNSFGSNNQIIVFSGPALVDCHF